MILRPNPEVVFFNGYPRVEGVNLQIYISDGEAAESLPAATELNMGGEHVVSHDLRAGMATTASSQPSPEQ